MKKKLVSLLLVLAMVVSPVLACSAEEDDSMEGMTKMYENENFDESRPSTANSDERYPEIVVAISADATELQPYNVVIDAGKITIASEIYESLMDQPELGEYTGRLAKDWHDEDDTHFVVELYDYIYDSDGNNITADDVVFSYNLTKDSGYAYDFSYFESCEAIDDYTVEFTWTEPLDSLTAFGSMMTLVDIVSEEAYNTHEFSTDPVGTGPYKVSSFITGNTTVLEARDDYWQTDELRSDYAKANVQTIEWDVISDSEMMELAYQSGDSSYLQLTSDNLTDYNDNSDVYYLDGTMSVTLIPNMSEDSPCNDINFRLAMYYALDNEAISMVLGSTLYKPVVVDAGQGIADYDPTYDEIESYETQYDPDLAKEYLDKSVYNGETIRILTETFPLKTTTAQMVYNMLGEIGIDCEIMTVEHALVDQYLSDTTAWDLWNYSVGDDNYVITRLWNTYSIDAGKLEGLPMSYDDDPEFEQMLKDANSLSGYSVEATRDCLEYIIDNALGYGTTATTNVYAFNPVFAKLVKDRLGTSSNAPLIGACDFYLD